jgi:hypothetical protein
MSNEHNSHLAKVGDHVIDLAQLNDASLRKSFIQSSAKLGDAMAKYQRAHQAFQDCCGLILRDQGLDQARESE